MRRALECKTHSTMKYRTDFRPVTGIFGYSSDVFDCGVSVLSKGHGAALIA